MSTSDDPAVRLVRQFLERTADEETVERFDEALEQHGIYRALEEAAVGVSLGFLVTNAREGPVEAGADPAQAPRVHTGELPDDEPRRGVLLTIDVPHNQLRAELGGDIVYLGTPAGVYEWDLEDTYDVMEWDTEEGSGVSRLAVMKEPMDVEAEFVDVDAELDEDEDGGDE